MFWWLYGAARGGILGLLVGVTFSVLDRNHHLFSTKIELALAVGALVGLLVGKPFWLGNRTRGLLKAIVGAVVCTVLVALMYGLEPSGSWSTRWTSHYLPLSLILGALWGGVVAADEHA
ncbi:MAG: hypothetical protein HY904_13080 [Deltaproteobacteria bacterium]|nr:hypothetical protein [Deltaproteobacteria bacterium]